MAQHLDLPRHAGGVLDLNLMLARERLPCSIKTASKTNSKASREAPRLPQSKITCDENHHHNNANNIENIVHVSFSFLSCDRISH
jgi:hypothetical protein